MVSLVSIRTDLIKHKRNLPVRLGPKDNFSKWNADLLVMKKVLCISSLNQIRYKKRSTSRTRMRSHSRYEKSIWWISPTCNEGIFLSLRIQMKPRFYGLHFWDASCCWISWIHVSFSCKVNILSFLDCWRLIMSYKAISILVPCTLTRYAIQHYFLV